MSQPGITTTIAIGAVSRMAGLLVALLQDGGDMERRIEVQKGR